MQRGLCLRQIIRNFIKNPFIIGSIALLLAACSSVGIAPGGPLGSGAPAGGAGEALVSGSGGGGSGEGSALPGGGGPSAAADGGSITAKSDDALLGVCQRDGRWRVRYNPKFPQILDATLSKNSPAPYALTSTRQAFLLLEAGRLADIKGNWSDWYQAEIPYQMRMAIIRDGRPFKYQDVTILWDVTADSANVAFQKIPAEKGDVLELSVFQHSSTVVLPDGTKTNECTMQPPDDYNPAPTWANLSSDALKSFSENSFTHPVGSFIVTGFDQEASTYKVEKEVPPFYSPFRVLYGPEDKTLDPNPKASASSIEPPKDGILKLLLEINYTLDPSKPEQQQWIPASEVGPQVRAALIPQAAKGLSDYHFFDFTLDGFVQLSNGMGLSYGYRPDLIPTEDQIKGAYNVIFNGLKLNPGDRLELYYYTGIDEAKTTSEIIVYKKAPAITDENSWKEFKENPDTYSLGSFFVKSTLLYRPSREPGLPRDVLYRDPK